MMRVSGLAPLALILTGACGGPMPHPSGLAGGLPGAAILGRIASATQALTGDISGSVAPASPSVVPNIVVNGIPREVFVAPDQTFVVKEIPYGTAALGIEIGPRRGYVTLDDVVHGEIIELVLLDKAPDLGIEVMNRDRARLAYDVPSYRPAGLQVTVGGGDYFLQSGLFVGNLEIDGNGVRVFGRNQDEPCATRGRTVFSGDLVVRGDDVEIYDVAMKGRLIITGSRYRVHDACDGIFSASAATR